MSNDPIAIARAIYEAYAKSDRDKIESLVADDFHFTSPLDNRIDRKRYFELCWPNNENISAFEFVRLVADGECVYVTYEATSIAGKRFRNTEILTIRNGKLVDAEVYFGWNLPHQAPPGEHMPAD